MTNRELTDEAQEDRANFEVLASSVGCTCFITAPCWVCVHPGNPHNQEDDQFYKPAPATEVDVMQAVRDFSREKS